MAIRFFRCMVSLPCLLLAIGGLIVCSGCGDKQPTASSQVGGPPARQPGAPPAPPTRGQAGGSSVAGMQPGGTNAGYPGSPMGTSGAAGSTGTNPSPDGGAVPAVDRQSNLGVTENGPGTGAMAAGDGVPSGPPEAGFEVGDLAPEIEGDDLDGEPFRLSDYRGKVVVVDFWGDW
jgi:hypothetical protein